MIKWNKNNTKLDPIWKLYMNYKWFWNKSGTFHEPYKSDPLASRGLRCKVNCSWVSPASSCGGLMLCGELTVSGGVLCSEYGPQVLALTEEWSPLKSRDAGIRTAWVIRTHFSWGFWIMKYPLTTDMAGFSHLAHFLWLPISFQVLIYGKCL